MNTRFVFTMMLAMMLLSTQALAISTSSLPMSFDYTQNGAAFTGSKSFTLRLYDVSSGGTAVWSDTQIIVFADGKASIQLDNLESVDWTDDVWFTAEPNGGNEMSPRLKLLMAPDALNNPFNYNRLTGKVELRNTSVTTVLYTTNITGVLYTPQICLAGDCKTAWPTGGSNSSSNITSVAGLGPYLIGNASSGAVVIELNETKLNATIDARTLGQEGAEDYVGSMVSGNTESLISVTYDDGGGKLNFAVTTTLSSYSNDAGFITAGTYPNLDTDSTNDLTTAGGTVSGNLTILGRLTIIGDVLNATVTNQYLNGSFYPSAPLTFDIGSEAQKWKDIFAGKFHANDWTNVTISKSQITESVSVAGTCADGYVVQNTTTSGVQCILMQTGTGDVTDVLAADTTIIVTSGSGPQPSVGVNTTYLADNYVGQSEYSNLDTDSTNDLTTSTIFANASGDINITGPYNALVLRANCIAITGSSELCDGGDAGTGGGMTTWTLSNGSTTEAISDGEQVNITAGRNVTITQVGSQIVINAIDTDTDTNTLYTNGTGLLLTSTQFNISTVYFDNNYVGQTEYANLDTDSTNDLTTGTTFVGDVTGAYNALEIGADTVGDSELNTSQVTLNDFTNDAGFITTGQDQNNYTITCTISGTTTKTAQCSRNGAANYSYTWTDLDTDTNSGGISNVTQFITGSNYLIINSNSTTFNVTANLTALNAAYNDTAAIGAKASPGTCAAGSVVQNTTTGGVQCVAQTVDTNTQYTNGTGLSLVGTQFNHTDTSSVSNSDNSGNVFIQDITFDTMGHVATIATGTAAFTDTNSGGVSNVTQLITGNNYLIVNSNSTTFNITANTTALDANFVGQSEYSNLDTDSTNDLTTTSVFNNASGDINVSGTYNALVLEANCVAITGSADLCDGGDAGGSSYTNGTGLSLVGTEFNHSDTSTQASSDNNGRTYIQDITLDGMGHITAIATAAETVVDTNSGGVSNVTQLITGNNYLIVNSNSTTFNITANFTSLNASFNDSAAIAAKASPGTCAAGTVVQNTTTGGVQCYTLPTVYTYSANETNGYIAYWVGTPTVLQFNETKLNATIVSRALATLGNATAVNTSANIKLLGFNTTAELNTYFIRNASIPTCGGTDKLTSAGNGVFTCTADESGSGGFVNGSDITVGKLNVTSNITLGGYLNLQAGGGIVGAGGNMNGTAGCAAGQVLTNVSISADGVWSGTCTTSSSGGVVNVSSSDQSVKVNGNSTHVNITRMYTWETELLTASASVLDPFLGTAISSGALTAVTGSNLHPGQAALRDSTTANGGYRIFTDITSFVINGSESAVFVFQHNTAVATSHYRMGFQDSTTVTLPTDGCFFWVNQTLLNGRCRSNNVESNTSSSYTMSGTTTWFYGTLVVNSAGTSVNFTLYDENKTTQLWSDTVASNIPSTTARATGFGILATESSTSAAANIVTLDYMGIRSPQVVPVRRFD